MNADLASFNFHERAANEAVKVQEECSTWTTDCLMTLTQQNLRIFFIRISIEKSVDFMNPDSKTRRMWNRKNKEVVGDLLMLQSSSRGEIWEGAGDHCLQSRRTRRSQVEATVGRPQCHFLHLYDSSCTWKTIWMANSSGEKETIGRMKHPPVGDAGGHYLQLLSSYLPWVTQIRQPCESGAQAGYSAAVCCRFTPRVLGKQKKDTVHTGCILILLFFLSFFFSTLRSSFEQLKARKSTRALSRRCCHFCPIRCDSFCDFGLQNWRTSGTFTSSCLTFWKRRWKRLKCSESARRSRGRR